jgi:hypothetical protein
VFWLDAADAGGMESTRTLVMTDPVTDQVLWVCSGAAEDGRCPHADRPPYVCQGLRVVATHGTRRDGASFTVDEMVPGWCPAAWIGQL